MNTETPMARLAAPLSDFHFASMRMAALYVRAPRRANCYSVFMGGRHLAGHDVFFIDVFDTPRGCYPRARKHFSMFGAMLFRFASGFSSVLADAAVIGAPFPPDNAPAANAEACAFSYRSNAWCLQKDR